MLYLRFFCIVLYFAMTIKFKLRFCLIMLLLTYFGTFVFGCQLCENFLPVRSSEVSPYLVDTDVLKMQHYGKFSCLWIDFMITRLPETTSTSSPLDFWICCSMVMSTDRTSPSSCMQLKWLCISIIFCSDSKWDKVD